MNYLSVCSGIEAATQAWHPMGWTAEAFAEVEAFPSAVLAHHYPETPNLGDMTAYEQWNLKPIDLLVGGTPCQSFSVAGLRKGLSDPRGNLMLTYLAIAARLKPRWIVWENVPGVLSSNGGRDFGTFLGGLAECGYGFAYRVLDAQYVRTCRHPGAVPQRRRRVFVVGHLGDWRRAAAVLFDRESMCGNPPPSREAGKGTAADAGEGAKGGCTFLDRAAFNQVVNAQYDPEIKENAEAAASLVARGPHAVMATGQAGAEITEGHAPTLNCNHEAPIAFERRFVRTTGGQPQVGVNGCLRADTNTGDGAPCVAFSSKDHGADASEVSPTLRSMSHDKSHANGGGQVAIAIQDGRGLEKKQNGLGLNDDGSSYTIDAVGGQAVAFAENSRAELRYCGGDGKVSSQLTTGGGKPGQGQPCVAFAEKADCLTSSYGTKWNGNASADNGSLFAKNSMSVRRLTPVECERLQGFPDGFTRIPWRNKPAEQCPDGPRYKALGNSMAVNCMEWIGQRIEAVEKLSHELAKA